MSCRIRLAGALLALLVLSSGCAVREERPAGAWLEERTELFATHPQWSVNGRVALRDGQRGGQLSFDWQTDGDIHQIGLRTVTGGRQWRLFFGPGYAELEGSEVGLLVGADPDELVEIAVGWPIPVAALSWWIRGLMPPGSAEPDFAADGTIQSAWTPPWKLTFRRYADVDGYLLPSLLEAESGDYRVRVALRNWEWSRAGD